MIDEDYEEREDYVPDEEEQDMEEAYSEVDEQKDEDAYNVVKHIDDDQVSTINFVGKGWDCTCYGSCLSKHYAPKSENDDDCRYCGHHISDHTPR